LSSWMAFHRSPTDAEMTALSRTLVAVGMVILESGQAARYLGPGVVSWRCGTWDAAGRIKCRRKANEVGKI
jgi:hypothetical protein